MRVCLRPGIDLDAEHLRSWLQPGKHYVVLAVEPLTSDSIGFRIVSEDGNQPVVFKASLFEVVDRKLPESWVVLDVRENMIALGPEAFGHAGFWARCFDQDPEALEEYGRAKSKVLAES